MSDMRRRKIIVTGGNGYVGRVVTRLLYEDHDVCVADSFRIAKLRFKAEELERFRLEKVDVTRSDEIAALAAEFAPDVIIHLAAVHYIPECERDPDLAVRTNVSGTVNAALAAPPGCRFVYASSGAVYRPDTQPHSEAAAAVAPTDIYGLSKLHGEQYVRYLAHQRDLAAVIVRLFNVVGPGETNPHLLPEILAQLKAGRSTVQLGNLSPKRDYIHVEDAARGFVATALHGQVKAGQSIVVNLGTSRTYSVEEVICNLRRVSGADILIDQERSRMRPVDRPFLAADIGRIRRRFGWRPRLTLDDALAELWRAPELADELTGKYL
jgi:UDP-glucose 4-epimerase